MAQYYLKHYGMVSGDYWDDPYLAHYGIMGMKWGVRRYQNPDGSLTSAGKKRYGVDHTKDITKEIQYKKMQLSPADRAVAAGLGFGGGLAIGVPLAAAYGIGKTSAEINRQRKMGLDPDAAIVDWKNRAETQNRDLKKLKERYKSLQGKDRKRVKDEYKELRKLDPYDYMRNEHPDVDYWKSSKGKRLKSKLPSIESKVEKRISSMIDAAGPEYKKDFPNGVKLESPVLNFNDDGSLDTVTLTAMGKYGAYSVDVDPNTGKILDTMYWD
jgi:hypothetical protein